MNFLTLVLCICMNRPYQFYYFVPLVSFWFLVFYCILNCPPVLSIQVSALGYVVGTSNSRAVVGSKNILLNVRQIKLL